MLMIEQEEGEEANDDEEKRNGQSKALMVLLSKVVHHLYLVSDAQTEWHYSFATYPQWLSFLKKIIISLLQLTYNGFLLSAT